MEQFAYLSIVTPFLATWIFLLWRFKQTRAQQTLSSICSLPLGFTEFLFTQDYWHPVSFFPHIVRGVYVESLLYAFCVGGIAAVVYEVISNRTYQVHNRKFHPFWFVGVVVIGLSVFSGSVLFFHRESMWTALTILACVGVSIVYMRSDLLNNAIMSGFVMAILIYVFYVIFVIPLFPNLFQEWWVSSVFTISSIPIEEMLFGFIWGFAAGPAYEFAYGLTPKRLNV